MTESIWPTIHAERRSLADDLAALRAEQWTTRSMCSDWDVHQVLAHLVATAKMTPARFFTRFAAAGFDFDRFSARQVELEGSGGPTATLAEFRAVERRQTAPPGPKDTWLGEAFVHGEDIRRPLGLAHAYPLPEVTRVLRFYARSTAIIGGKRRVGGVTLTATDTDLSIGSGPSVEGPALSLLLAAAGRPVLSELSGPGVDVLRDRARQR